MSRERAQAETGVGHAFAEWICTAKPDWPAAARHNASRSLLDTLGVMVPGAREDVSETLYRRAREWGAGECRAIGHEGPGLSPPLAALVNGTAAHALDYDDLLEPQKGHASAVLWPAILAVAEARRMRLAPAIDAYIVGLQILARLGQGMNPCHRDRGWHATSSLGAVGAAAAVARLLGLDANTAAHAVNMATSMSGGFMSQFGSMVKPLHAGLAAKGGVMAGQLAQAGITAGEGRLVVFTEWPI